MKSITLALLINSFLIHASLASDCLTDYQNYLPAVKIPNLNLEASTNSNFCYDEFSNKDKDLKKMYEVLKSKKVFDENYCIKDEKFDNDTSSKIANFIAASIKNSLKIYTDKPNEVNGTSLILFTNSDDINFVKKAIYENAKKLQEEDNKKLNIDLYGKTIKKEKTTGTDYSLVKKIDDNKLDTKDTLEIAGAAISASLIGTVIERKSEAFRTKDGNLQHDKLLHTNFGTMINIGSVAGAYLLIETAGVGDKLKLTKNQKKWTILLTGTVVGLLVGYGKERFYDYYHQDIHTYDPHVKGDMGATWLGAGALNALTGSISFQF